jgi:hypothetical protein
MQSMPAKLYTVAIEKHPNHDDPYTAIRYIGFARTGDAPVAEYVYTVEKVLSILDEGSQQLVSLDPDKPGTEVALKPGERDGKRFVTTERDKDLPNNLLKKRELTPTDKVKAAFNDD